MSNQPSLLDNNIKQEKSLSRQFIALQQKNID